MTTADSRLPLAALLTAFAERDIDFRPNTMIGSVDADRKVVVTADGEEIPYDLFLAVPRHRAPAAVVESGMCVDGWIPVDPHTLQTQFPGVYAVGDVTSVGTPKAGVFAEGQAAVVAAAVIAGHAGAEPSIRYDGTGKCYLEFGNEGVARVEVTFRPGQPPTGGCPAYCPPGFLAL